MNNSLYTIRKKNPTVDSFLKVEEIINDTCGYKLSTYNQYGNRTHKREELFLYI